MLHVSVLHISYYVFYCCTNNAPFMVDCPQVTFACSKSTIETLEKGVKYVQS